MRYFKYFILFLSIIKGHSQIFFNESAFSSGLECSFGSGFVGGGISFVDFDNEDYHLANGSPCIDAGIEAGAPTLDLEGLPRVDEVDMGAFENQKTTNAFNTPRQHFWSSNNPNSQREALYMKLLKKIHFMNFLQ